MMLKSLYLYNNGDIGYLAAVWIFVDNLGKKVSSQVTILDANLQHCYRG